MVAGGKHIVPAGVSVEELDGGKSKLQKQCPPLLENMLKERDARFVYDSMVDDVVKGDDGVR